MPDAVLYLRAMAVAAGASTLCVLAFGGWGRPASERRMNWAGILGLVLGLLLGYQALRIRFVWPPGNALGRLLLFVLPAATMVEACAATAWLPRRGAWCLRIALAMLVGRVLLHDAVYLAKSPVGSTFTGGWTKWECALWLTLPGLVLVSFWSALSRLAHRSPGICIPLALCEALLCAGACIMLAGYVTGGAACLPVAAAVAGIALGTWLLSRRTPQEGMLGIAVVGLFALVCVGRFFGGLSTAHAVLILLAPLLCWVTELPWLRKRNRRLRSVLGLCLVALLLVAVCTIEKRNFDRKMTPGQRQSSRLPLMPRIVG